MRFAVVSDIHADELESRDTYVASEPPPSVAKQHPLADLIDYVTDKQLKADWLICPGDLANKANSTGKAYGWKRLHELATALDSKGIFATPGNHDVVTHTKVDDPAKELKLLNPSFPSGRPTDDETFWRDGFSLWDEDPLIRILNLNSCHSFPTHPGPAADPAALAEYFSALDRGAFTPEVQKGLKPILKGLTPKPVNILLCHHHPVEHERLDLFKDTYGPMERGGNLVQMLEDNASAGRWLIIHGHKHVPNSTTAGPSSNSPLILCSASLGGKLWHPIVTVTKNQFHVVEFDTTVVPGLARTRGVIRSYMWGYGSGWQSAQPMSGLPATCGFGVIHDFRDLAQQVRDQLVSRAMEFESWSQLCLILPALRYQGPKDLELLEDELEAIGFRAERDRQGRILKIARSLI